MHSRVSTTRKTVGNRFLRQRLQGTGTGSRAKTVLFYLQGQANQEEESWYAIGRIARNLSLSRSTIKRTPAYLARLGQVESLLRYRENGGRASNFYWLKE